MASALAPASTTVKLAGLTKLDKVRLLDQMTAHDLRALVRYLIVYAPAATDRAIAERLAVRGTAARVNGRSS
jgi:hypothetical protein